MKNNSTSRDAQRVSFVESLHSSLQKQTVKAMSEHNRLITLAKSYIEDGLSESESIELLMIDGLNRDASESYISLAMCEKEDEGELSEYSFQFEDDYGRIWSSYDLNKTVRASSNEEALQKISDLSDIDLDISLSRVVSVSRIND